MIERCRQSGGDTLDRAQYLGVATGTRSGRRAPGTVGAKHLALGTRIANVSTVTIVPTKMPEHWARNC
jgi:hypothetical protein